PHSLVDPAADHRDPPSFPTRRSSDLETARIVNVVTLLRLEREVERFGGRRVQQPVGVANGPLERIAMIAAGLDQLEIALIAPAEDRKSTRLNSSHQIISYAVFCLKKK